MSTNIEVNRICQYCNKEFVAKKTTTRFCSHLCNSRDYKARIKANKISVSNKETIQKLNKPILELNKKEFLTVTEASKLINCSRQNIYKLINTGKLKASNILEKKTIIKRLDIEVLFQKSEIKNSIPQQQLDDLAKWKDLGYFNITDCYTLKEIQEKFKISETALQNLIKRNNIPKIKKGWFAYVPKKIIDSLLK
ncbi:helix-turn-helix domain-containing protein [Myroides marinus]|uniref:helix-turn-helix domain-containing protein n=1 Tax=Myroides marinus TaxID=703342 RepID=UPI002575581C|nr:helix-turn-helix domain-containing protein [Myroides marinus]MDM1532844.1 helix-turn-helix domain-containing protein [Myroides marinus]MDM1539726.1 helix-turn-helix domain-containing protein [Myroides marinus]